MQDCYKKLLETLLLQDEEMIRESLSVELIYSLFWMSVTKGQSHKHRREINSLNYVPDLEIANKSSFSIESDENNPDPNERLFRALQATGVCTVGNTDYQHLAIVQVLFDGPDLRTSLRGADIEAFLEEGTIIPVFLEEASGFDRHFESSRDGRPALAALPHGKGWFFEPRHFAAPVNALSDAGYCEPKGEQFRWSRSVGPHMQAAGLWVGEKTIDQIREAELSDIWDTMPPKFKQPMMDQAKQVNGLDILSFAMVMGHFWYDGKWHDKPENPNSLKRGNLPGGFIPTARELGKLFDAGKLKA